MNKAILRIHYEDLMMIIAPPKHRGPFTLAPGIIPEGVEIVDAHVNYQSRGFDFILAHDSFPRVAAGCMLTVLPGVIVESPAPIVTDKGQRSG